MKNKHLLIILFFLPFITFSQDGSPDLSFGDNGIVITDMNNASDIFSVVDQAPSGRIIVAGTKYGSDTLDFIIAYLEDGTIDASFGNNGILLTENEGGLIEDVIVQEDENILIGRGYDYTIIRYLPDGSIDTTFGDEGNLSLLLEGESKKAIVLTQEGKILFCGYDSNENFILKRFLQNGELDIDFGVEGTISYAFGNESNISRGDIELMADGSIVIGVKIINSEITTNIIVRFHEDGSLDTSYGANGIITIPVEELFNCTPLVFANGNTLARCSYWDWSNEDHIRTTIKFHPNGNIDQNFGNAGYMQGYIGEIIQANQRILHASRYYDWEGGQEIYLSRLFSDGSLDPSFNFDPDYFFIMGKANVLLLNSGKVMIAGSNIWYNWPVNIILQQFHNDPLGIEDHQLENVSVYPNPSNGIFKIQHDILASKTPYQVTDVLGKIITTGFLKNNQTDINLSNMKSGIYFLSASNKTVKLIKN